MSMNHVPVLSVSLTEFAGLDSCNHFCTFLARVTALRACKEVQWQQQSDLIQGDYEGRRCVRVAGVIIGPTLVTGICNCSVANRSLISLNRPGLCFCFQVVSVFLSIITGKYLQTLAMYWLYRCGAAIGATYLYLKTLYQNHSQRRFSQLLLHIPFCGQLHKSLYNFLTYSLATMYFICSSNPTDKKKVSKCLQWKLYRV